MRPWAHQYILWGHRRTVTPPILFQETDQGFWVLGVRAAHRCITAQTLNCLAEALVVTFPFNHQSLTMEPLPGLGGKQIACGLVLS